MKYMIIIYGSQQAWDGLTEAAVDELAQAHAEVQKELLASGELIASSELDENAAKVVRADTGTVVISDGPFTEGQQIASGYYLVDCADMARATEIASRFAEAKFAPIEVRQLGKGSTWTDLQKLR